MILLGLVQMCMAPMMMEKRSALWEELSRVRAR